MMHNNRCRKQRLGKKLSGKTIGIFLIALVLFTLSCSGFAHGGNAKYIILFIGDGWGVKHIEAVNKYTGTTPSYQSGSPWVKYMVSTFPEGGGYNSQQAWSDFNYVNTTSGTQDSACTASSIYSGSKTSIGRMCVSPDASARLFSIGERAKELGKTVGSISSVNVSHATPGAWIAHNDSRVNTFAIADEGFFGDPNTTGTVATDTKYGGGHGPTMPPADVNIGARGTNYVSSQILNKLRTESGQTGKHVLVERQAGVSGGNALMSAANNTSTLKLAGLFDHVYHNANGSGYNSENPTLSESILAAIKVLDRNPNGFVLMVEGGAIDWASHANNMNQMIGEAKDFDNAIQAVTNWVDDSSNDATWNNTLVIVTADHECGYLTAGPGVFPNQPLGNVNSTTLSKEKIVSGSNGRRASWEDTNNNNLIDTGETVYWYWNSGGHTNSLIPLYARGTGSELFVNYAINSDSVHGPYLDNTDIFTVMNSAIAVTSTDTTPPEVVETSPVDLATGVSVDSVITATFNEAMDPATINMTTFTVGGVTGTVSYNGTNNIATFTPSANLSYDELYMVTITSGVKDVSGNGMLTNYMWSFTTVVGDTIPPEVSATNPVNNATDVSVNSVITATFNETMDPATINTATFMVGGVTGTVSYNGTNKIATFTPSANLSYDTLYTVTITTGVKDVAGNGMTANYNWSFTTGSEQDTTLQAYYKFDEGVGTIASDSSGNNRNGTITGATWTTGKIGSALSFDGNDYVKIPRMNYDEISVSAWFNKNASGTNVVFGGWKYNSNVQLQEGFDLFFPSGASNRLQFTVVTKNTGGTRTSKTATKDFTDSNGSWYHVVGTYNMTTGQQKLYVDGQLVNTQTHPSGNMIVPLTDRNYMTIGARYTDFGLFRGSIDDVRVYNRALSDNEVLSLFNNTAETATQLVFVQQPSDTTVGTMISPAVTVQLQDSSGNNVSTSGVLVTMSLSSGTGSLSGETQQTTDAGGLATFDDLSIDEAGIKNLTASSAGLTSAVSEAFTISEQAGIATQVVFVQQPSDTTVGTVISPAVTLQLQDGNGNNVSTSGVSVTMSLSSGTGSLSGETQQTTDAGGLATFDDLSIDEAGIKNLTASSTGLTSAVSDSFTISEPAVIATQVVFVQQPSDTTVGTMISPAVTVQLQDSSGNNVSTSGVSVTMSLSSGTGVLSGEIQQITDANGLATFDDLSIDEAGIKNLTASSAGLTSAVSNAFTIFDTALLAYYRFDEGFGTNTADSSGNGNDGVLINGPVWTTGKINNALSFDGLNDYVMTADTPFDFERTNSFSVSAWIKLAPTTLENPIFSKEGSSPAYTGWGFYVEPGSLRVFLTNKWNSPSNGIVKDSAIQVDDNEWHHVAFTYNGSSLASGVNIYIDGNLSNGAVTRDNLSASILNDVPLSIGALAGTSIAFKGLIDEVRVYNRVLSEQEVLDLSDTTPPMVSATSPVSNATEVAVNSTITATFSETMDASSITTDTFLVSNGSSNIVGTVSYSGTTATFTPSDNLAFSTAYTATITTEVKDVMGNGMASSYIWSFTTGVSTGAAAKVVFVQQPSDTTVGTMISPAVMVQLQDGSGNNVATSGVLITMSLSSGTGVLSGETQQTTDAGGLATFDDLSIDEAGIKNLTASSAGLTSAVSNAFTISEPIETATQLVFVQQPSDTTVGTMISPAVTVQLQDSSGNNVSTSGVLVTMSLSSGTGSLSGETQQTTDAGGLATFDDLSIDEAGIKNLTASSAGLTSAVSNSFTISEPAVTATQVVFVQQPSDTTVGTVISPAVTVQLQDGSGNNVSTSGVLITMSLSSGTGVLSGTTQQPTDANGLATFDDLSIDEAGIKNLTASSAGLTSAVSDAFTISEPDTTLQAYYKFDEGVGTIATDSSGNDRNGAITGATWTTGKIGSALSFDGNDYVKIPRMNHDAISVSAWFNKNASGTNVIFGGWRYNANVQLQEGFDLFFPSGAPNRLQFTVVTKNTGGTRTSKTATKDFTESNGSWYHVVGTYNMTTGQQKLYVDGQLVNTQTHPAGNVVVPLTDRNYMTIGARYTDFGLFRGSIDDVRVYNRALSDNEVLSLFNTL